MFVIKSAILSLSVTLIFLGVAMLLSPKGAIHKAFKSVVSVCLVTTLILSIVGVADGVQNMEVDVTAEKFSEYSSNLSETVLNQEIQTVENSVKSLISQQLKLNGIHDFEILVESDILKDNGIYIDSVTVICDEGKSFVCQEVLDSLSINGTVREGKKNGY